MFSTGSTAIDAERAFTRQARARRRAVLANRLRHAPHVSRTLPVFDETVAVGRRAVLGPAVREIPIDAISGTVEPGRASMFDACFRPARSARSRWERVWRAEQEGHPLPPIDVVSVGDGYAVRDGHHRVSVARARGGMTIDAVVDLAFAA
jgi:hypothetical protein